MFGNFILRKLLASKMKGVPEAEQEKIFAMIEKKPELFQKIATEAQAKIAQGRSQQDAMMETIKNHEAELKDAMK